MIEFVATFDEAAKSWFHASNRVLAAQETFFIRLSGSRTLELSNVPGCRDTPLKIRKAVSNIERCVK